MKHHLSFSLFLALVLSSLAVRAQEDNPTYNENVVVTGSYRPVLDESNKINVAPAIVDTGEALQHKFTYNTEQTHRLTSLYEPSRIKAARVVGEPKTRLYNNYFRLGFGNYWSPMLEAYYNSLSSKNLVYGASLSHHSSWGTIGDNEVPTEYFGPNHFSLTDLNLYARYNMKPHLQLATSLNYQNDYNLYYGFCDSTLNNYYNTLRGLPLNSDINYRDSISTKDYRATYNYFAWNGSARLLPHDNFEWNLGAAIHLADLLGNHGHNEFRLGADLDASHPLELDRSHTLLLAARLSANFFFNKQDYTNMPLAYLPLPSDDTSVDRMRPLVTFNPYASITLADFNIHAGFTIDFNGYSAPHTLKTYFFPDVTISRNFLNQTLALTIGAVGSDNANTWNNARLLNPYVMFSDDLRSQRLYTFFAQANYKISKKLFFNGKLSYNLYHDYLTFQLDPRFQLHNVFMPKYESFNQFVATGDFAFVNDELLTVELGGTYYKGGALPEDTLPGLYHPLFDAHLNVHLNYNNKILVHIQSLVRSKMNSAYEYDATAQKYVVTETVPMRYGINLEVEYRHNRALSFFLKVDNLAFQRYYYWQNYPSQKALFIAGLTYTIH